MRRQRVGFILIVGTRPIATGDDAAFVETRCPNCGQQARLQARTVRHWLTFFFIPIFPVSGKKQWVECDNCHWQFPVGIDELRANLAASQEEQQQRAIALYNSLRSSPANSVTLNELMALYASMDEHDQAISAAGQFPQALHASEQCMTTLARIYLEKNLRREALQWLDAAIARNPALAEAHYYRALSHLTSDPPDPDRAIESARMARRLGYPRAEELLAEAQRAAGER